MLQYLGMAQSTATLSARYFFVDLLGGIIAFPVWWYTVGFVHMAAWAAHSVRNVSRNLGLSIWVRNLFVPMYGEHGIEGRLISFFMRLVMIIGRGMGVLVWSVIVWTTFALYLVAPAACVFGLLFHAAGALL